MSLCVLMVLRCGSNGSGEGGVVYKNTHGGDDIFVWCKKSA